MIELVARNMIRNDRRRRDMLWNLNDAMENGCILHFTLMIKHHTYYYANKQQNHTKTTKKPSMTVIPNKTTLHHITSSSFSSFLIHWLLVVPLAHAWPVQTPLQTLRHYPPNRTLSACRPPAPYKSIWPCPSSRMFAATSSPARHT